MSNSPKKTPDCTWLSFPGYCYDLVLNAVNEAITRLHVKDALQHFVHFSKEYPMLFVATIAIILTTAFPITVFFMFIMCSVIFGFTGLVLIEGALITTGSLVICGFIGSLIVILLVAAASLVVGYFGISQIYSMF